MKFAITLTACLFMSAPMALATGIEFFQGTFAEAKEAAAAEGKLIFVDAYTTWCGPCKRMSKNVFTLEDVGEYYNETFVNVKLDMEKGEGKTFQREYRVTAFPTLLFLDPMGKLVHRKVGGMDGPNFIKLGRFAASKSNVTSDLDQEYADGARDPAFMAKYVKALAKAKRPLLKITNEYLSSQPDLTSKDNLTVIFYGTVEADSRIFNLLVKNRKAIEALFGAEKVAERIEDAGWATVAKAIQYDNADLMMEAVDKVKRYASDRAKAFELKAKMSFYAAQDDPSSYLKSAKSYARMGTKEKVEVVNYIAKKLSHQPSLMSHAERWSLEVAKEEPSELHCLTAAQILYTLGKYGEARKYATEALEYATQDNRPTANHIKKLVHAIDKKLGA